MDGLIFVLYVQDQERSKEFYSSLLLKEPVRDVPGLTEYEITKDVTLGLIPESGIARITEGILAHPAIGNGLPRCEVYFYVKDPEEWYVRAISLGAYPISPSEIRYWGDLAAYCADPDGHIIAFAQRNLING